MNHLELAFTGKNAFWRYFILIVAAFAGANTIGSIPLLIPSIKTILQNPGVAEKLAEDPMNISLLISDPLYGLFSMLFPFLIGLVTFAILFKPINERSFISSITGSPSIRWSHFLTGFCVWAVLSSLYLLVYYKIEPSNFIVNNTSISLLWVILISVSLIPFQAAFEEVIFRGYLMQGFATVISYRWFPLIMTSVLFGLMHSMNPEVAEYGFFTMMPQYIVFGMVFGIATLLDDGIEVSLGAHAANNIFLVIMVTQRSSALQSPALFEQQAVYPWTEFAGLVVSGILFLIIMKIILKWRRLSIIMSSVDRLKYRKADPASKDQIS
ncbi:MAG TPA: CPBP family intramembrane glutamic endopeptidase [Bacteroidales bacterium]|nr:CPBP family intramembrane glutamic endopeptidase [Bacteroidales bacterium]